jgi:hypothetical protein
MKYHLKSSMPYILSPLIYMCNRSLSTSIFPSNFVFNNEIYMINLRHSANIHLPLVKLSKCKKGPYYMGIKLFNHLPQDIRKLLYDVSKFKAVTKSIFKGILLLSKRILWVVWYMKSNSNLVVDWIIFYHIELHYCTKMYACTCITHYNVVCITE